VDDHEWCSVRGEVEGMYYVVEMQLWGGSKKMMLEEREEGISELEEEVKKRVE